MGSKSKKSQQPRVCRTFSEEFKRSKVKQIESGIVSVLDVSREFKVSATAVYKWITRFGTGAKATSVVVQLESEEHRTRLLRSELHELERAVGRKQIEIDYLTALIEAASDELGVDLKKNFSPTPSSSSDTRATEAGR
jgi:transposase